MTEFYRPAGTYVIICLCPDTQEHVMERTDHTTALLVCPHCNSHVCIQTMTTEED